MPVNYDEKKHSFTFCGNFCSWECMKSYNLYSNSSFKHKIFNYIHYFHDTIDKTNSEIGYAPPRSELNVFGGHLNIKEFRKNNKKISYKVYEYPVVIENKNIEKFENFTSNSTQFQENDEIEIANEPIKLKRKTSIKSSQNTLEKSMGIFKG